MQKMNRIKFNEELIELINSKREDNSFFFSREKYETMINEVKAAKVKCSSSCDYRRLKRFDIMQIKGQDRLIVPLKEGETHVRYYVTNDEIFDILAEAHSRIGHGGRRRTLKELQIKYKNITFEVVMLFLSLCKQCQTKRGASKNKVLVTPMISSQLICRCQVEFIDFQSRSDNEYKFVLVYQDCETKFMQLKPLKSKKIQEVTKHLLEIFLSFGAPAILHSNEGRKFSKNIVEELRKMWKDVKILHGKSRPRNTKYIENMLLAWMTENHTSEWSLGLGYVQFSKNTSYHSGIRQSPYEAMFKMQPRRGLMPSSLPHNCIAAMETEEQLEEVLENLKGNNDSEDNDLEYPNYGSAVKSENCEFIKSKTPNLESDFEFVDPEMTIKSENFDFESDEIRNTHPEYECLYKGNIVDTEGIQTSST